MGNIRERGHRALNLEDFNAINPPEHIGEVQLEPPSERQYILRMLIKRPFEEIQVPDELKWCQPMIDMAFKAQEERGIRQPFLYLTVRHGVVSTKTDDVWHVDGFSQTITHLPEQNYLWCSHTPTEVALKAIAFPVDFDSSRHNIHDFFSHVINEDTEIVSVNPKTVYAMDPYVIHRRPKIESDVVRTFVRLSFTPIEINDVNNTFNPNMPTNYKRDGRVDFRDKLVNYHKERIEVLRAAYSEINKALFSDLSSTAKDFLVGEACMIAEEMFSLDPDFKIQ